MKNSTFRALPLLALTASNDCFLASRSRAFAPVRSSLFLRELRRRARLYFPRHNFPLRDANENRLRRRAAKLANARFKCLQRIGFA